AACRRVDEAGVAKEICGGPSRHAQISPRLIAGLSTDLNSSRQRVVDDARVELPGQVSRIDRKCCVRLTLATLASDSHQIDRIADAVAAGSGCQAAGEWLHRRVGKAARSRIAAKTVVKQKAGPIGNFEIVAQIALDGPRQDVRLGGN